MLFKELLKEKSISQKELANKLNVSPQLITSWTKGRCQPQLDKLTNLSEILQVSIEDILNTFIGAK